MEEVGASLYDDANLLAFEKKQRAGRTRKSTLKRKTKGSNKHRRHKKQKRARAPKASQVHSNPSARHVQQQVRAKPENSSSGSSENSSSGGSDEFMEIIRALQNSDPAQTPISTKTSTASHDRGDPNSWRTNIVVIKPRGKSDTTTAVPFHLVLQPGSAQNKGQFLGKAQNAKPLSACYKLAWVDDNDGDELQQNSRPRNATALDADWSDDEVLVPRVSLNQKGQLSPSSLKLIQNALPRLSETKKAAPAKEGKGSAFKPEKQGAQDSSNDTGSSDNPDVPPARVAPDNFSEAFVAEATKLASIGGGRALRSSRASRAITDVQLSNRALKRPRASSSDDHAGSRRDSESPPPKLAKKQRAAPDNYLEDFVAEAARLQVDGGRALRSRVKRRQS
jgi:hypothetical protein